MATVIESVAKKAALLFGSVCLLTPPVCPKNIGAMELLYKTAISSPNLTNILIDMSNIFRVVNPDTEYKVITGTDNKEIHIRSSEVENNWSAANLLRGLSIFTNKAITEKGNPPLLLCNDCLTVHGNSCPTKSPTKKEASVKHEQGTIGTTDNKTHPSTQAGIKEESSQIITDQICALCAKNHIGRICRHSQSTCSHCGLHGHYFTVHEAPEEYQTDLALILGPIEFVPPHTAVRPNLSQPGNVTFQQQFNRSNQQQFNQSNRPKFQRPRGGPSSLNNQQQVIANRKRGQEQTPIITIKRNKSDETGA